MNNYHRHYGEYIHLDKDFTHGVKLEGINFSVKTKFNRGYFDEVERINGIDGNLTIGICRNIPVYDFNIFNKDRRMSNNEKKEIDVNDLPDHLKTKLITLWEEIELELAKTKPLYQKGEK